MAQYYLSTYGNSLTEDLKDELSGTFLKVSCELFILHRCLKELHVYHNKFSTPLCPLLGHHRGRPIGFGLFAEQHLRAGTVPHQNPTGESHRPPIPRERPARTIKTLLKLGSLNVAPSPLSLLHASQYLVLPTPRTSSRKKIIKNLDPWNAPPSGGALLGGRQRPHRRHGVRDGKGDGREGACQGPSAGARQPQRFHLSGVINKQQSWKRKDSNYIFRGVFFVCVCVFSCCFLPK